MTTVLVIGATSAIAESVARRFAESGDTSLCLVGRRPERIEAMARDLEARGARTSGLVLDVNDIECHQETLDQAVERLGDIDVAFVAHGTLPDQEQCQVDAARAVEELNTNAVSTIALLTLLANRFERQGHGTIAVVTSVAGDRGRQSNYVYGAAKAAVDTFLEGLRQRLHKTGVSVVTIKPGLIDTPMTAAFDKGILWSRPDKVAGRIHRAIERGSDVVYVPAFWRAVMLVIRSLPRFVFKAIRL